MPSSAPVFASYVQGLGFWGFQFRASGLGFRVQGLGFRVRGLGLRVQGLGFRVRGLGLRVQGFGFWAWDVPAEPHEASSS